MLHSYNRKKILLVGASSLLGKALIELKPENYQIVGTINSTKNSEIKNKSISLETIDICNKEDVEKLFLKHSFETIIHTASIGNIDTCEKNKYKAYKVNVIGTSNIVTAAHKSNSKIIFISSSAVFNGSNAPYSETSLVCPVNFYGRTKVIAEKLVLKSNSENTVIRLPLMYGWNNIKQRKNIVTWIKDELHQKNSVMLSSDRYTNPIFNEDVAKIIFNIIEKNCKGIYHLGGPEIINRVEMGRIIAEVFKLDSSYIKIIKNSEYNEIANRAYKEYLDISKMLDAIKIKPLSTREALIKMREKEKNMYITENDNKTTLKTLKTNWLKKHNNNNEHDPIRRKIGLFNIYYNLGRAKHLTDQLTPTEVYVYNPKHDSGKDVFCKPGVLEKQKIAQFNLNHYLWNVLSNISPIDKYHSLLLPQDVMNNQHLNMKFIEDMFHLSSQSNELFIAVNSWGAGASQNHFHSHLFFSKLPIIDYSTIKLSSEQNVIISKPEQYPIVVLIFSSDTYSNPAVCKVFNTYIQELISKEIPYNVLFHDKKLYLAPRKLERDTHGIKKGVDAVFGTIPVTTEQRLEQYTLEDAFKTLQTVGFININLKDVQYSI